MSEECLLFVSFGSMVLERPLRHPLGFSEPLDELRWSAPHPPPSYPDSRGEADHLNKWWVAFLRRFVGQVLEEVRRNWGGSLVERDSPSFEKPWRASNSTAQWSWARGT